MNKKILALGLCLVLMFMVSPVQAASLQLGSSGSQVTEIQRRLKQWGYYTGSVDGIYGSSTQKAVIAFQKKNGLNPDGVVGTSTARAIGITLTGSSSSSTSRAATTNRSDLDLLARVIHGEARGESYTGKVAVAAVVLNRVESPKFPNTIAGVVYQPYAFTCVADGQINLAPDSESISAATDALNGVDPTGGAIYYYNPATATSSWIYSRPVITTIGQHVFAN